MNNSDNNDKSERDLQSIQEKICNYILSNLLSVLSVISLIVGGFIFWFYFLSIGYFPSLNFNDSVLFLLVAAITGVAIVIVLTILIISPYILHRAVLKQKNNTVASGDEDREKKSNALFYSTAWYFLSMFFICYVLFLFLLVPQVVEITWINYAIAAAVIVLLVNLLFYGYISDCIRKVDNINKEKLKSMPLWEALKPIPLLKAWILSIIPLLIVFSVVIIPIVLKENSLLLANKNSPLDYLLVSAVVFLLISFANIFFAYFMDEQKNVSGVIFIILFVIILFYLGQLNISKLVMRMYKFGDFETQQLLVDKEGCKILKHLKLISNVNQDKVCNLKNAKILSRLGHSFYIETRIPPLRCQTIHFSIPSKHILSWGIINTETK